MKCKKLEKPKQLNITQEEIDALVTRMDKDQLSSKDKVLIKGVFEFAVWLDKTLNTAKITIGKLKRLLGFKTEKRRKDNKVEPETSLEDSSLKNEATDIEQNATNDLQKSNQKKYRPTHNGRNGQNEYKNAEKRKIALDEQYKPGILCKYCERGKMYKTKSGIVLRLFGSPMVKPVIYELETLRCNLCSATIKAKLPVEAKEGKHSYSLIAQVALQKLLVGVPYNAQAKYHKVLETPLPASTQWMLVTNLYRVVIHIFNELVYMSAQSWLCTIDDTKCRILSVIKENKKNNKKKDKRKKDGEHRKGTYTTGLLFDHDGKNIALYISGRQYAGENLNDTLKHREAGLQSMHVMADGSSNNNPGTLNLDIVMHNCLTHSRRQFYDLSDYYEEESLKVIDFIAEIYKNDKYTKENKLSANERLKYHKKKSAPILQELKKYLEGLLLDKKKCEPNGALTGSINYVLNRWTEITRFLEIPNAPLDSNAVERLLKVIIRMRKTAMFFKTESSAKISSSLLSVIQTCVENKENPLSYLIAIQKYEKYVIEEPKLWMPWNYKKILQTIEKPELIDTS